MYSLFLHQVSYIKITNIGSFQFHISRCGVTVLLRCYVKTEALFAQPQVVYLLNETVYSQNTLPSPSNEDINTRGLTYILLYIFTIHYIFILNLVIRADFPFLQFELLG